MMDNANNEGFRARLAGVRLSANPYPPLTAEHTDWAVGWYDQDEHLKARDECLAQIGWFG